MGDYKLVNPYIKGTFKNKFSGKNSLDASLKCWKKVSKYFSNSVPRFAFTLENMNGGEYHHFIVNEDIKDKKINFTISELKLDMTKEQETTLKNKIKNLENDVMDGGKHKHHKHHKHHDDSSSDSSSTSSSISDYYTITSNPYNRIVFQDNQPIEWWWYSPIPYKLDTCYVPTFVVPLRPYVTIYSLTNAYGY